MRHLRARGEGMSGLGATVVGAICGILIQMVGASFWAGYLLAFLVAFVARNPEKPWWPRE